MSFASKPGLKGLNAATTLSNTNYTRNLKAQEFTTQSQFTEAAQGDGQFLCQAVGAQGSGPAAPVAPAAVPFSTFPMSRREGRRDGEAPKVEAGPVRK